MSTRLGTTDGVSLETEKWTTVLRRLGHHCFFFAGLCDRPAELSYVVPEAHFTHPAILQTYNLAFNSRNRPPELTRQIQELAKFLKQHLNEFARKYDVNMLVVGNALAIPLNIPLGIALTEFIAETGTNTIGHYHDPYWERRRFLVNCVWDYLDMSFPPRLPSIRHMVINSTAAAQLSYRRSTTPDGRKIYSLWDVYPFTDVVTYPSLLEGFGNAFLEAMYFRRPIVVNDYTIHAIDIRPKGFRAIELDGFITEEAVTEVEQVLRDPALAAEMAEHKYQLAKRFYSYAFLEHPLQGLLQSFPGEDARS